MKTSLDAMKQALAAIDEVWRLVAIGPEQLSKTGVEHLFEARSLILQTIEREEAKMVEPAAKQPLPAEREELIKKLRNFVDVWPGPNTLKQAANMLAADAQDTARIEHLQQSGSTVETDCASWSFRIGGLYAAVSPNIRTAIDLAMGIHPKAPDAQQVAVPQPDAIDYAEAYADSYNNSPPDRVDVVNAVYWGMRFKAAAPQPPQGE